MNWLETGSQRSEMNTEVKRCRRPSHVDGGKEKVNILVLRAMELLLGIVFVGWMMMWAMLPTSTYWQVWLPKLQSLTSPKSFGSQEEGGTLLIFVFPPLFIAVIGCIYLHLRKRDGLSYNIIGRNGRIAKWRRRPALVKGPLGTVSRIELGFFAAFLLLLIWCFSTFLRSGFKFINRRTAKDWGEQLWEAKLWSAGLQLGYLGSVSCAFLFFPVARGSSILPLLGLTSEGSIKYHIWLGHIVMAIFTAHGICYIVCWIATGRISEMIKWKKVGVANVPGEIALTAGLVMWVTSIPRIRRKMFELFYYTHHLYFLFLLFFLLHVGISDFFYVLPGLFLFLIDRYLRFLQSQRNVRLVSARVLPCQAVELNFSKSPSLDYTPTSVVFVNVPSISSLQWHPFTVTSSSNMEPDELSVLIKSQGSWSQMLYQSLSSSSPIDHLRVSVEGPYGPPTSTHFLRHDALVMVSGGSGITPFISIIRELMFQSTKQSSNSLPRILLISAFKNSEDLAMLDLLLPIATTPSDNNIGRLNLHIEAFITREKEPQTTMANSIPLQTAVLWFKPRPSDEPISRVLGSNGWLWLGVIISTSFIMYLTLIVVLNRYYIYAIEHNTNRTYSYTLNSLFSVLFICGGIAAAATAAVLWNKKRSAMEAVNNKQPVQNTEDGVSVSPNKASPAASWFYSSEQELEGLPQQSLVQATKVHFGARPELKKMVLECEGSSIGVMACGPTKMTQEVATICSSPSAEHLHFESISFSW